MQLQQKAESRLAKINVRYSSSKMLDLSRKFTNGDVSMLSTAANTTVADMTTADMTASERTLQSMIEMNRPEGSDELFQLEKVRFMPTTALGLITTCRIN